MSEFNPNTITGLGDGWEFLEGKPSATEGGREAKACWKRNGVTLFPNEDGSVGLKFTQGSRFINVWEERQAIITTMFDAGLFTEPKPRKASQAPQGIQMPTDKAGILALMAELAASLPE